MQTAVSNFLPLAIHVPSNILPQLWGGGGGGGGRGKAGRQGLLTFGLRPSKGSLKIIYTLFFCVCFLVLSQPYAFKNTSLKTQHFAQDSPLKVTKFYKF